MELKNYQKETLQHIKVYLENLVNERNKFNKFRSIDNEYDSDFTKKAWEKTTDNNFYSRINGINEYLPNFCLKVPTGGGKTLLAAHTIDLIQQHYTTKKTGFVLWIVPSEQIYSQTLATLKNREHPYRQVLDLSSGGRTFILEKNDHFTFQDVEERLCIMLLMLPSANRQNKETLKMFRDTGSYSSFFPPEGEQSKHQDLLNKISNLDYFHDDNSIFGIQLKTSLGNVLRLLQPIIIIDEGHRAYSKNARNTLANFNPKIMVELSATPPEGSNVLVSVSGTDLNNEEMIKLDLHVINKASTDWKQAMLASIEMRNHLEDLAQRHQAQTGRYIRPINLIQVERTGKEQRDGRFIHTDDVIEYLVKECGISVEQIAVKTSAKNDIEGIDLLSKDCPIRYIITKQALQEGWDCPFAYVLTVLANTAALTTMTQLVGRILRQPYAKKTNIPDLNESYVFCFRQSARTVVDAIRNGLMQDGMGDLISKVVESEDREPTREIQVPLRERFKDFYGKLYLPRFVIQKNNNWREVNYEMDIIPLISWEKIDINPVKEITLSDLRLKDEWLNLNLDEKEVLTQKDLREHHIGLSLDTAFMTRHLLQVIPNPWIAYDLVNEVVKSLQKKYSDEIIVSNLIFILEKLVEQISDEKDRMAEEVFRTLIEKKIIHFFIEEKSAYKLPSRIQVKETSRRLTRDTGESIQLSLFEYDAEDQFNELEKTVAVYLDKQEKLLWWYRNISRAGYAIQGWKKNKIYPDFVYTKANDNHTDYSKIHVLETKGLHLKNDDTKYKKDVFKLCNDLGKEMTWNELGLVFDEREIEFQVLYSNEWKNEINQQMQ